MSAEFRLSVAVGPTAGLSFADAVRLAKVGLLYADHTVLCTPGTLFLSMLAGLGTLTEEQQLDLVLQLAPQISADEAARKAVEAAIADYRNLPSYLILTRRQRETKSTIQRGLRKATVELQATIEKELESSGALPLVQAVETGHVSLHPLGQTGAVDDILKEYIEFVLRSATGADSFPMFDSWSASLFQAHLREQRVELPEAIEPRMRNAPLTAAILERLPLFHSATIPEIIDIRRELAPYLTRFRSAMLSSAGQLRSLPWDQAFSAETDALLHRDLLPAVLDIEDAVKSNKYLTSVVAQLAHRPVAVTAGSVLGFGLSKLADIPGLAVGTLMGAGGIAVDWLVAHREWLAKQRQIEGHQLYFYYRAKQVLG